MSEVCVKAGYGLHDTSFALKRLKTSTIGAMQLETRKVNEFIRGVERISRKTIAKIKLVYQVIRRAVLTFGDARGAEAAASMAYYAFFSLFPMLLFFVAVGSFVLQNPSIYQIVVHFFGEMLPSFEEFIAEAIEQIIALRGPVSVVGVAGLLWSASAYFVVLTRNLDRAWPHGRSRNYIQQRMMAFKYDGSSDCFAFTIFDVKYSCWNFSEITCLNPHT